MAYLRISLINKGIYPQSHKPIKKFVDMDNIYLEKSREIAYLQKY